MQETQETQVWSLGWEDPLEEGMSTHSSIFAWRIPWTKKPGRLQSLGSHRVGHKSSNLACTHALLLLILFRFWFKQKNIAIMRQKFEYWLYIWYMYIKMFKDKLMHCLGYASKIIQGGFPGGSVVKKRRVFDPWSGKILHAEEQLSPWATITETVLLEPGSRKYQPTCHSYWTCTT